MRAAARSEEASGIKCDPMRHIQKAVLHMATESETDKKLGSLSQASLSNIKNEPTETLLCMNSQRLADFLIRRSK